MTKFCVLWKTRVTSRFIWNWSLALHFSLSRDLDRLEDQTVLDTAIAKLKAKLKISFFSPSSLASPWSLLKLASVIQGATAVEANGMPSHGQRGLEGFRQWPMLQKGVERLTYHIRVSCGRKPKICASSNPETYSYSALSYVVYLLTTF